MSEVQAKLLNFIEHCKKLLAVLANVVQLKGEAFLSVCDLLIVFGHCTADCGKAPGQATLEPLALHPDRGMAELLNIFIQDHVFIDDDDEDFDEKGEYEAQSF